MLIQPLTGMLLVVSVATGPAIQPDSPQRHMSPQQKSAAMQPLVRSATECITRTVGSDPRFDNQAEATVLGDLIVDAVPSCIVQVRAMIDAYDHFFGEGAGETFFMGPYLDVLPTAVSKAIAPAAP
jgi:hypothetical protein